jgi:mono/diheme cytochrome c family protein
MKTRMNNLVAVLAVMCLGFASVNALAEDANPRRGKMYYKMVCTGCHMSQTGKSIPPMAYTIAEWNAYFDADRHDKSGATNPSLKYYAGQAYRKSIAGSNKAAAKFLDVPDAQMLADVRAYAISGAKDSDSPASCE